jgi:hypothetical protein
MAEDLDKLNVAALKELARKHLGKGFSRLKTKADLVEALRSVAHKLAEPVKEAVAVAVAIEEKIEEKIRHAVPAHAAPKGATSRPAAATPPVEPSSSRGVPEPEREVVAHEPPVHQGFFVSRVAGPVEAERHHLTESSGAPRPPSMPYTGYDERLGELPDVYEDDAELLLPRDPSTLFFLWDYARDTRRSAADGLPNPRARLRVFDGENLVRELDFALESRSYYVRGLAPGRSYHVEAYFVGDYGAFRRLGRGTNRVALPMDRPSDNLEIRFMRIPWEVPLSQLRETLRSHPGQLHVVPPLRMDLPSSQTRPNQGATEGHPHAPVPSVRVALPSSFRPQSSPSPSTINPR